MGPLPYGALGKLYHFYPYEDVPAEGHEVNIITTLTDHLQVIR